jgi:hypothetical protein
MSVKIDELFYELNVRTSGVKDGLDNAERSLGRFTSFVKANPMASMAALAAAIGAVGYKATSMAADVERAGARVNAVFPGIAVTARALSNEFGVAQTTVLQLFDTIEKNGEKSRRGLETTAVAALKLNQALHGAPEDVSSVAAALKNTLDLFHLNSDAAEGVAARLFQISAGKVPLDQLVEALHHSATIIQTNRIGFDQAAVALARIVGSGVPARQAVQQLATEIGRGKASFDRFTAGAGDASQATAAFEARVTALGDSADVNEAKIKTRLNNALVDLGQRILPIVNAEMEGLVGLLDQASGKSGAFRAIDQLGDLADRARAGATPTSQERFFAERGVLDIAQQAKEGDLRLADLDPSHLQSLTRTLQDLNTVIQNPTAEAARVRLLQQLHQLAQPAPASQAGPTGSTPEQLAAGHTIIADIQKTLASFTTSLADDTSAALEAFRAKVSDAAGKIPPELAAQFKAATDAVIANYIQRIADIKSGLQAIKETEPIGGHPLVTPTTQDQRERTADQLLNTIPNKAQADTARFTAAADRYAAARQAASDAAGKDLEATLATARLIDQAVQGALDLGTAFGVIDQTTASIFSNISQVATGIGPMVKAIKELKAGTGGVGSVVATALPVIGGIAQLAASLFGPSPQDEALRKAMEKTADAVDALTKQIGNLGNLSITGNTLASAIAGIAAFNRVDTTSGTTGIGVELQTGRAFRGETGVNRLNAALKGAGTSLAELQDLADGFGLSVDFTSGNLQEVERAFKALNEAIQAAELTKFAQTFSGQLDALQARFKLFHITDPVAQAQALLALQGKTVTDGQGNTSNLGSPTIANALGGVDLSTAGGQAAAEKIIQGLFDQLNSADKLSPDQQAAFLGGLTAQQFLDTLLQLQALLDQAQSQGGTGQTEGFAVSRTITEVTGDRLAGILTSSDARLQELVDIGNAQLALLGGGSITAGVSAAAASLSAPGVGGGGDVNIDSVSVSVGMAGATDPVSAGQQAAKAFVSSIDAALGRRARAKLRQFGNPLVRS